MCQPATAFTARSTQPKTKTPRSTQRAIQRREERRKDERRGRRYRRSNHAILLLLLSSVATALLLLLFNASQYCSASAALPAIAARHTRPAERRHLRALPAAGSDELQREHTHTQAQVTSPQQTSVPYKTFYLTRACEWKSSLFVPKSNDILFAQAPESASTTDAADPTLLLDQSGNLLLRSEQKALVVALPLGLSSNSFAGYEPACSLRLIVPRHMRILARISARRLTLARPGELLPGEPGANSISAPAFFGGPSPTGQLWLNVSQNQFIESEEEIVETVGNVLAFRFLLERFASRQAPDTRFQAILTAFQTLDDYSSSSADLPTTLATPPTDQNAPFICDQQRLIASSLACDGFKNCIDGRDEDPATCAMIRLSNQQTSSEQAGGGAVRNQMGAATQPTASIGQPEDQSAGFWVRVWRNWLQPTASSSSLLGFLVGFLLVLALLTCCTCCLYCCYVLWRRHLRHLVPANESERTGRRQRRPPGGVSASSFDPMLGGPSKGASLAEADRLDAQNQANAERVRRQQQQHVALLSGRGAAPSQVRADTPTRSILKKKSPAPAAPLARFVIQPEVGLPDVPPARPPSVTRPPTGSGPARVGALASSLTAASGQTSGRLPASIQTASGAFRPTPAARQRGVARGPVEQPSSSSPMDRSRPEEPPTPPSKSTSSATAAQTRSYVAAKSPEVVGNLISSEQQEERSYLSKRTTTTSKTSTTSGAQRLTVYEYSSDSARYSESYLQRVSHDQTSSSGEQQRRNKSSGDNEQPEEAAQAEHGDGRKPRQSSLI